MTALLLTEPLPMRKTSQLGTFAEDAYQPIRYGDLRKSRFRLIRLTATRYLAAGHAMQGITRAFVADLETKSFAWSVVGDGAGNVWTVVDFAAPVPQDATVTACGLGKVHGVTGALIENPADLAADIMLIAGRTDPWWGELRAQTSGVALAGSITEPRTLQEQLDVVVDSCGGMWCYGMAQVYPLPVGDDFVLPMDRFRIHELTVSAALPDTADALRVFYAHDEALGRAASYVEVAARPERFGGIHIEVTLPMLRTPANAETVARRLLGRKAGERVDVHLKADASEFIRPGIWLRLQSDPRWPWPDDPYVKITAVPSVDRTAKSADVIGEALLSTPAIDVVSHSVGTDGILLGGIEVTKRNGAVIFTVRDQDGRPQAGARVSLDGGAPKTTDASGEVTFPYVKGAVEVRHELAVESPGLAPQTVEVYL